MTKRYRIYIDESGDHYYGKKELRDMQKGDSVINVAHFPELEKPEKRYLCVLGCIIESSYYKSDFQPKLENIKRKHFNYDPDQPFVFHRKELVNKKGVFSKLLDAQREKEFNAEILEFFRDSDYTIIAAVIDKKKQLDNYKGFAYHPYNYCLNAILERYCGFLQFNKAVCDVLAESRGGEEDTLLKNAYSQVYISGTNFRPTKFFQDALTSKEIKIKKKTANIAGLQLADLIAHPVKTEILIENNLVEESEGKVFGRSVCEVIKNKYNSRYYNGKVGGYGKILL
ncbi:MAG: hypothetical protein A2231_11905 [Candidatus Firestonebacteria bacterium RIFOXYA2_FULL_40_8]|nr:MAG: hypothetical protein A2231_11905 [Candidatus Firestonebacteria bacterium RIFOXYA2_FULL_40_8]